MVVPKSFECADGKKIDIEKCNYQMAFHITNQVD